MCGICGIANIGGGSPPDNSLISRMIGKLSYRWPDSSGYYRDRQVALGHTRLAIIDIEGGSQPLSNEQKTIWIVFYGEIFNYIKLSSELSARGHILKTKSDTQVIVHAYEECGLSCFDRFNGQWALALWDRQQRKLIISRDRLGIRLLYYAFCKNKFIFASEIKAILQIIQ